jgi:hypothetical protein
MTTTPMPVDEACATMDRAIARIAELEAALYPFALAFKGGHTGWITVGMLKRAAKCFSEVVEEKS